MSSVTIYHVHIWWESITKTQYRKPQQFSASKSYLFNGRNILRFPRTRLWAEHYGNNLRYCCRWMMTDAGIIWIVCYSFYSKVIYYVSIKCLYSVYIISNCERTAFKDIVLHCVIYNNSCISDISRVWISFWFDSPSRFYINIYRSYY